MDQPLISVIIPIYNSAKYLRECLDSVCYQTLKDIEIILINDGSSDNSIEICEEYAKKDDRIYLHSINNSGAAVARNLGLKYAQGEFIAFVDSDDYIDVKMFGVLYSYAKEYNADIIGSNYQQLFGEKIKYNENDFPGGLYSKSKIKNVIYPKLICSDDFSTGFPKTMVTKIFSYKLIKQFNIKFIPELKASQDVVFTTNCMLHSNGFYHLDKENFYTYRQNNKSRTNSYLDNSWSIFKKNVLAYNEMSLAIKNYDFSNQINLATIRSAMTAISYEGKTDKKVCHRKRLYNIEEILNDKDLVRAIATSKIKNIGISRKLLLKLMKYKLSRLCYLLSILNDKKSRLKN